MEDWLQATLVAASVGILVIFIIVIIHRCLCPRKKKETTRPDPIQNQNLQTGMSKLQQVSLHHLDRDGSNKRTTNYYVFRRGFSTKPFFNWSDHPSLITDAVENGWSRFAFTTYTSSPSIRSAMSLLGPCGGDQERGTDVEINWEVSQGSADFLQKIRLNSGLLIRTTNFSSSTMAAAKSVIRTGLPLPGPPLGNSAFPQEAYFEITILNSEKDDQEFVGKIRRGGKLEGEKIKLIQEDFNAKINIPHHHESSLVEDLNIAGKKDDGKTGGILLSIGLSCGGSLPLRLPGSYPGSIGFNSNGSVHLDGEFFFFSSFNLQKLAYSKVFHLVKLLS